MDLTFLLEYTVVVVVGICLCVGYVLKTSVNRLDNKYIPLIMAILGVILNVWINQEFTPEILLGGMFSGLASTGLHQMFKQMIHGKKEGKAE